MTHNLEAGHHENLEARGLQRLTAGKSTVGLAFFLLPIKDEARVGLGLKVFGLSLHVHSKHPQVQLP